MVILILLWKYTKSTQGEKIDMQKCICIPVEQYELMLETYDKVVEELEKMKKAFEELADSTKAE